MAVCAGSVPVAPEEQVELLAVLAFDADSNISERAQGVLITQPTQNFLAALARTEIDPHLSAYCSDKLGDKPGIADALAKNSSCPTSDVTRVAPFLTTAGIQALLDNLERFINDPQLVIAVQKSKVPTNEQRELLNELEKGAISMNEIEEVAAEIEPDKQKRETLQQKVAQMNVVQRLTLALKGGRSERMFLIRDPNKLVQRCVLQSPRLTETEVESFAAMSNLPGETLRAISLTRSFMKSYSVLRHLVNNPKTPLDVSLHLFPRLTATDLLKLCNNKNVPETLRSSALKLHRKRKSGGAG